jgi:small subunit ribosomal protein S1
MGQEFILAQQPDEAQQAAVAPQTERVELAEQAEETQPAKLAPSTEPEAEVMGTEQAPPSAEAEETTEAEEAPPAEVEAQETAQPEEAPLAETAPEPEPPPQASKESSEPAEENLQAVLMAQGIGAPPGEENPMEALLHEDDYGFRALHRGQIVEGVIVQVRPNELLVDVGSKSEGVVMQRELDRLGADRLAELSEGDTILVYVVSPEDKNGNVVLSLSRAQMERDWREAQELFDASEIFDGKVAGFNKGGLIVRVGKVRGFVPASQVVSTPERRKNGSGQDFLSALVGQDFQVKIIEIDRSRNRLILSERAAQRELRKLHKEKLLQELQVDEVREGQVISLCDFGAFVDLGGADGLVHLSELSWRRVSHPSEVLKVGDQVKVKVLNVDRERRRIGLSLKRLESDPWSTVSDRYHVDQLVEGTVTKLVKFGAFARIFDDDIEGLIHLSELSDERITHPREVVQEGDVRTLRVIRIDPERRRIGLSLKRVASDDYLDVDWGDEYDRPLPVSEDLEEEQEEN